MKKVLVTYATRTGSTFEIASTIAEVLRTMGATVDVKPVPAVHEIESYNAVIIGSAIRMSHWLPEAVAFVKTHRETLSHIPTAYFLVSGLLRDDTPAMRRKVLAFLDPVRKILKPISIGMFAGKIDFSRMDGLDRSIAEGIGSSEGDWRNWETIRQWTRDLQPIL